MFLRKMWGRCLSRKTGLYVELSKTYCDKKDKKMSEVDIDKPDEIDAFEERVNGDDYNNLYYNLHSQQVPRKTTGVDISNFEAIDNYEKLFEDSYRKHIFNTRITEEAKNFDAENSYDLGLPSVTQNEGSEKSSPTDMQKLVKAQGRIFVGKDIMNRIVNNKIKKDILTVAEIAGILGAKKTSELVPHYFSSSVQSVKVDIELDVDMHEVIVTTAVHGDEDCRAKALTGCSIALVTIFNHFIDENKDIQVKNIGFMF